MTLNRLRRPWPILQLAISNPSELRARPVQPRVETAPCSVAIVVSFVHRALEQEQTFSHSSPNYSRIAGVLVANLTWFANDWLHPHGIVSDCKGRKGWVVQLSEYSSRWRKLLRMLNLAPEPFFPHFSLLSQVNLLRSLCSTSLSLCVTHFNWRRRILIEI